MERKPSVHLYLIRHGMTAYNQEKKYLGHTDIPVIPESLDGMYRHLKSPFACRKMDKIISSDLTRCRQTAEFLFQGQSVILDKRLREMDFGDWEGYTYDELKEDKTYCSWLSAWRTKCIPNGESWPIFHERIEDFLESELQLCNKTHTNIAIVTHKGVIREIFSLLANEEDYWSVNADFGTTYVIALAKNDDGWRFSHHETFPGKSERT